MSEKRRIVVPDGMLVAAAHMYHEQAQDGVDEVAMRDSLEAAIRWLVEDKIQTPLHLSDLQDILNKYRGYAFNETLIFDIIRDGIGHMFLAHEPEVPEAIKDLLWDEAMEIAEGASRSESNERIIEAHRRGREAK